MGGGPTGKATGRRADGATGKGARKGGWPTRKRKAPQGEPYGARQGGLGYSARAETTIARKQRSDRASQPSTRRSSGLREFIQEGIPLLC